jgi:aryl-alcohol dehydrogenase-like predicted oxidoreductase
LIRPTFKIRRGAPPLETSRLNSQLNRDMGPQAPDESIFQVVDALDQVAAQTGKTIPQIALNWLLARPTVSSVIVGARNEQQLRQNLGAVGWTLTREQIALLDAASARPMAYPYWHQTGFAERNPFPV